MAKTGRHIAIFLSFSGSGGVERMIINLARGFLESGCRVDMVIARARGEHLQSIPEGVRQIRLGKKHTLSNLPALVRYLKKENPEGLLAVKDRAIKVAILARRLSGFRGRVVGRLGTTVSEAIAGKGFIRRWFWYSGMRHFFPALDHIVAVSEGVAQDIQTITGLPGSRVTTISNPVVSSDIRIFSRKKVDHPWFQDTGVPVISGVGRLTEQKDFPSLIRAFSLVREERPCRLVILGEGHKRDILACLVRELGLEDSVALPGFVGNPYSWLARSSLFVLSSKWEGSPNALTEALALGIPVVSTDCRSGPREILQGGKYGELVPVGDWQALAAAMERTLQQPLSPDFLREAARDYTVAASSAAYLEKLLP